MSQDKLKHYTQAMEIDEETKKPMPKFRLSGSEMEYYGADVSSRPQADVVPVGAVFMAVDTQEVWMSNGTTWVVI
jgi:hypothetical protein